MKKKIIYGCEARGDADSAYLTRYTLVDRPNWQLCLHYFYRSDADELHDHPWDFWSLILWRGYIEQTKTGRQRKWPLMLLHRKAEHAHRVVLVNKKPAITLVLMFKRRREWGFFTPKGWQLWNKYFKENGC